MEGERKAAMVDLSIVRTIFVSARYYVHADFYLPYVNLSGIMLQVLLLGLASIDSPNFSTNSPKEVIAASACD